MAAISLKNIVKHYRTGKTVTQITYYTADGVYVLPVNVAL